MKYLAALLVLGCIGVALHVVAGVDPKFLIVVCPIAAAFCVVEPIV